MVPLWRAACRVQLDAQVMNAVIDDKEEDKVDALEEFAETHRQEFEMLKTYVRLVVEPPIALAGGHRALVHKVAGQLFKWHLQVPSVVPFTKVAPRYVAHCSDMGTELGTSRFPLPSGNYDGLLPGWIDRTAMQMDVAPPVADSDAVADVAPPDPGAAGLNQPGVLDAVLSDSEPEEEAAPKHFLPRCLDIPGLQHICNNLNEDTHKSMSWWSPFHKYLKQLEALLGMSERNSAYINFCVRGTYFAHEEQKIKSFSGSLKEGRWRETLFFLIQLNELLPCLCATWDEGKFTAGKSEDDVSRSTQARVQERKEQSSGRVKFEAAVITECLSSGLFYRYCYMAVLVEEVPPALASYGEQCPCHPALLDFHKTEHAKKGMFALHYGDGHTICPLGGCMITLLVCGKLEESLDEVWAVSEDKLFTLPSLRGTKPMIDSEWAILFGDFRVAKVAASNFVFFVFCRHRVHEIIGIRRGSRII